MFKGEKGKKGNGINQKDDASWEAETCIYQKARNAEPKPTAARLKLGACSVWGFYSVSASLYVETAGDCSDIGMPCLSFVDSWA